MLVESQTITELAVEEELVVQDNKYLEPSLFLDCTVVMVEMAHQQILQVRT